MTETTLPAGTTEIRVGGADGYVVAVGSGLLGSLPALLGPRVAKVLIVHAPTLGARAEELRAGLVEAGFEVLEHADVCVIGSKDAAVLGVLEGAGDKPVIDLVRLPDARERRAEPGYVGIGW